MTFYELIDKHSFAFTVILVSAFMTIEAIVRLRLWRKR
jgi:hypothetical protein